MHFRYYVLLLGSLLLLLAAACKKHDTLETSNYTFFNATAERLQLDIYGSKEDYHANQHPAERRAIEAGGQVTVPLQALTTVWADWYSADYTLHNWEDGQKTSTDFDPYPLPRIDVAAGDDRYIIRSPIKDSSRSVLLNGNGTSSIWKAVVDQEPGMNGTHTFELRKDFSGIHTHTDLSGNTVTRPIAFTTMNENHSTKTFSVAITDGSTGIYILTLWFRNDIYPYYTLSRDRLIGFFGGNTYEFHRQ